MSTGPRVDLARRKPLRLALLLLADRWSSARGRGVSWSEVLEVAWPGERVDAESGFARVRNALAQLRKLGLRDVLKTRDDGYLLDPECPVRRAEI
jgi:DNA-binding SARP family transcriptional activator